MKKKKKNSRVSFQHRILTRLGPVKVLRTFKLFPTRSAAEPAQLSMQEQLLRSNEEQFRGGLVFKARRRLYHSTLGREQSRRRRREIGSAPASPPGLGVGVLESGISVLATRLRV